jgi:hypothetical protein
VRGGVFRVPENSLFEVGSKRKPNSIRLDFWCCRRPIGRLYKKEGAERLKDLHKHNGYQRAQKFQENDKHGENDHKHKSLDKCPQIALPELSPRISRAQGDGS